jgi:short-subunit dehydrogenase
MQLEGRTALVTGASSGIGAATARTMAAKGARVVLVARGREALEAVAGEIVSAGGDALVSPADLSDPDEASRVASVVARRVGTPDILVNNAGAGRWLAIDETEVAEAIAMMAVPYFASFAMTRALLPGMLARGSGHIVNTTSIVAFVPIPGAVAYGAARWAVRAFSEMLALDLRATGIGVTLLAPGRVASPYFANNPGSEVRIPRVTRLYRTLSTDEVAAATVRAIERRTRVVVIPSLLRFTVLLHRFWPRTVESMVAATGWRRPAR